MLNTVFPFLLNSFNPTHQHPGPDFQEFSPKADQKYLRGQDTTTGNPNWGGIRSWSPGNLRISIEITRFQKIVKVEEVCFWHFPEDSRHLFVFHREWRRDLGGNTLDIILFGWFFFCSNDTDTLLGTS